MDPQSLEARWRADERWAGIVRPFRGEDVTRLRGSVHIEHTLARLGAERFWSLLRSEPFVPALGALTGNQAVQQVQAGLPAIYMSGWQVAADGNDAGQTYPDQSLYPADSVPNLVRRVNNAFKREDEKHTMTGDGSTYWIAPIVADAEAGFGGPLNAFELMKAMIEAGAAGVHFEDQLASAKKCGHLGGKVLVPTGVFLQKLVAARLAADLCGVPTVLIARTDANSARLITSDVGSRDRPVIFDGERTPEGFHSLNLSMFELATSYKARGMTAYAELQQDEFAAKADGYRAAEHQTFVGTAYFDEIVQVVSGGETSTVAMEGSTEREQFLERAAATEAGREQRPVRPPIPETG